MSKARKWISEFIVCETNDPGEPHWQQPITRLLAGLGYRLFGLVQTKFAPRLIEVHIDGQDPISGHDLLAAREDADLRPVEDLIQRRS